MEKIRKYYLPIVIGLITLLGAEFRWGISNCPLWYDEGHSILVAIQQFPFGIDNYLFTKDFQHTPLYFYFLHFWIKMFGTSEFWLRFSSSIFGIATIPVTYIVGRKLCNKTVGIIAALLVAVSPLMTYYSIEIRMYAMVVFFAILSTNYLLDFEEKADKKSLIKLLVTNTVIPYLLIGGIVFNIGQAISYFIYLYVTQKEKTAKIKEYLTFRVYQLILLIPYFAIAIYYIYRRSQFIMSHIPAFQFINFVGSIQNFFGARVGALYWTTIAPYYINFVCFISVIVPIIYFINALIKAFKEKNSKLFMIFANVTISYVIILVSCMLKVIVLVPRYIIFIVPLVMVLAAVGLSKLKKWHLVIFLLAFSCLSAYFLFTDDAYFKTKYNAILDANNYRQSRGLTNQDYIYRPFSSSVAFIYSSPTSPIIPVFESMHEFRKPYNNQFYDDEQIELMKQGFVDEVLQKMTLSDGHISQRYYEFIKKTYLDPLKPGRYVLMEIYGPDNQALVTREQYRQRYSDIREVHNDRILPFLCKLFDDTRDIFMEQCDEIETISINDTTYLLFRKRPYDKNVK